MSLERDTEDAAYVHETQKEVWQHNRMFNGFPLLTVKRRAFADENAITGKSTETYSDLYDSVECDFSPVADEEVMDAAGLVQPGDYIITVYDNITEELDRDDLLQLNTDGRLFAIRSQKFEAYSVRLEIVAYPTTKKVA